MSSPKSVLKFHAVAFSQLALLKGEEGTGVDIRREGERAGVRELRLKCIGVELLSCVKCFCFPNLPGRLAVKIGAVP